MPILPGHVFLEDAHHTDFTGRSWIDSPARRIGDGDGEISPMSLTPCAAAWGKCWVGCLWSRKERRAHRARQESGGGDTDPNYTTGCCTWHNNLVRRIGGIRYAVTARLHPSACHLHHPHYLALQENRLTIHCENQTKHSHFITATVFPRVSYTQKWCTKFICPGHDTLILETRCDICLYLLYMKASAKHEV